MKLFRFVLGPALAGLVALAACQSSADKTTATTAPPIGPTAPNDPGAPALATPASSPGAGYELYRGTKTGQGGRPDSITLHLLYLPGDGSPDKTTYRSSLQNGYYGADGEPHELLRQRPSADSLVLNEELRAERPAIPDGTTPVVRWAMRRQPDGGLAGTRAGQPVRLRRQRVAVDFAVRAFTDSVAAFPKGTKRSRPPYGYVSLQTLVPTGGLPPAALAELAANILRQDRGDTLPARPVPALADYWQQRRQSFARDYAQGVTDLLGTADPADSVAAPNYALRFEAESGAYVLCQQANLLSLVFCAFDYAGGSSDNYQARVVSFDLRTGRPLGFDDIFRPAARRALLPLLARGVRRSLGLKSTARLDSRLLTNEMQLTTNVCLTPGGAFFVYGSSEIAPSAYGEIRVFIPLRELRPLLREGLPLPGNDGAGGVALKN